MTAWQTETLFSSHYKVSLSLFSSGNRSSNSIKVNDIACMCFISARMGGEYITLRESVLRKDILGFSCLHTHMLYYLVGLYHITDHTPLPLTCSLVSFSYSLSLHSAFPYSPCVPSQSQRGHALSSLPSLRALQPDNPAACCPPGEAEGLMVLQEKREMDIGLRCKMRGDRS